MRESTVSLDEFMEDLTPAENSESESLTGGTTITIWVKPEHKARYQRLQERTKRRFGKKVRELFLFALTQAEKKIS